MNSVVIFFINNKWIFTITSTIFAIISFFIKRNKTIKFYKWYNNDLIKLLPSSNRRPSKLRFIEGVNATVIDYDNDEFLDNKVIEDILKECEYFNKFDYKDVWIKKFNEQVVSLLKGKNKSSFEKRQSIDMLLKYIEFYDSIFSIKSILFRFFNIYKIEHLFFIIKNKLWHMSLKYKFLQNFIECPYKIKKS